MVQRFANCWFNYHSGEELQKYVKPFLDSDFPGAGAEHIGALYYVCCLKSDNASAQHVCCCFRMRKVFIYQQC